MSRTRSSTSPNLSTTSVTRTGCTIANPNGTVSTAYSTLSNSTAGKTIVDNLTPGFHTKRKAGLVLPMNYCRIDNVTVNVTGAYHNEGARSSNNWTIWDEYNHDGPGIARYFPCWVGATPAWSLDSSTLTQKAVESCRGKIDASKSQVLVTLAELAKTKRMVVDRGVRLALGAYAIGRGLNKPTVMGFFHGKNQSHLDGVLKSFRWTRERFHRPIRGQALNEMWLEYRYGWRPLVADIQNLTQTMLNLEERVSGRQVARSTQQVASKTTTSKQNYGDGPVGAPFTWEMTRTVTEELIVRATHLYMPGQASHANQFGLTAYAGTVWELVPFSFVVDWFVDVGGWISAWEPKPGVTDLGSCVTTVRKMTEHGAITKLTTHVNHNLWNRNTYCTLNGERTTSVYERTAGLPFYWTPTLGSIPSSFTDLRILDAVALIKQLRR